MNDAERIEIERCKGWLDVHDCSIKHILQKLLTRLEAVERERDDHGPNGRTITNAQYVEVLYELEDALEQVKKLTAVAEAAQDYVNGLSESVLCHLEDALRDAGLEV